MKNENKLKNFTRGGQTLLHNFRMVEQIFNRVIIFCGLCFLILLGLLVYIRINAYDRYLCSEWIFAKLKYLFNDKSSIQFITPINREIIVSSQSLISDDVIKNAIATITKQFSTCFIESLIATVVIFVFVFYWLKRRGKSQSENKHVRGDEFQSQEFVKKLLIKSKKASDLNLADLPLVAGSECAHFLIHGTIGSGKSICIKELLDQIRRRGERAIIYDKSCDFIRYFYKPSHDIILNPLDERGASWHLWKECRNAPDFDSLSAALIPIPNGSSDPFWIHAARTIFSATALQMKNHSNRSISLLLKALLTADLATMEKFLQGTEAETLVSEKIEKTAVSIKTVLATYLKCLKYVKDEKDPFSIRQWIQDENQNNWLFISSLADQHETLKPLISMWLDIAANSLMSLTPSQNRRIWLILDELPSLHKLPYLTEAFAESRKFGGCIVAGMQSISQLRKIYGQSAAEEISGLCNTRIFFREPSSDTAQWVSKELGQSEIEETREGISYGESAMRSGISISKNFINKPIINYSEVMQLNNLEAYVRLPGNWPITKIKFDYKHREETNKPFTQREIKENRMDS